MPEPLYVPISEWHNAYRVPSDLAITADLHARGIDDPEMPYVQAVTLSVARHAASRPHALLLGEQRYCTTHAQWSLALAAYKFLRVWYKFSPADARWFVTKLMNKSVTRLTR